MRISGSRTPGLSALAGLTKLRRLNLQTSSVTDAGLDAIRGMTELEELSLYRTKVTNAGLAQAGRAQAASLARSALQPRDRIRGT